MQGIFKWQKMCINEELLTSGIGSVREVTGVSENADYGQFMSILVASEQVAKSRGEGIWRGTEHVTTWNKLKNIVK